MDTETRNKIEQTVLEILKNSKMDEMTEFKIRKSASEKLEMDLAEPTRKKFVRKIVESYLMEQQSKEEEEEKDDNNENKDGKEYDDEGGLVICRLSDKRRVTLSEFKDKTLVSMREYYKRDGKELPTAKDGRGKSFTADQDAAICNAYLCITQDSIVGNSQKKERFWDRILAKYDELTYDSRRSAASIKARWSTIQKACSKFSGILRQIKRQHHSGTTTQNEIDLAKRHYKDDVDKPFPHLDVCWEILKHNIKFAEISDFDSTARLSQMETSSDHVSPELSKIPSTFSLEEVGGISTSTSGGSVQSPRKRPLGCKVSKMKKVKAKAIEEEDREFFTFMKIFNKNHVVKESRKAENEDRKDEMEVRKIAALEKLAEAEKMKADVEMMKAEEHIMGIDLDAIRDPQLRSYYQLRKHQIMKKLAKNSSLSGYFPDLGDY